MNKIRNNNGFTQIDIIISIIVLMLFVTLIAGLFINSYNSSTQSKRDSEATAYLTRILQAIDLIDYDKLDDPTDGIVAKINDMNENNEEKISGEYVNDISAQTNLSTPYRVQIKIENYSPDNVGVDDHIDPEDLVKIITIKISYINQKSNPIQAQRLKTKEISYIDELGILPDLLDGMNPISNEDENQITTKYASNWFDYSNKKVAEITLNDVNADENGKVSNTNSKKGSRFVYIPRFAYMNTTENGESVTKIKFLNADNTCKDGSSTQINQENGTIDDDKYYVPSIFTQNYTELEGIWVGKYLVRQYTEVESGQSQIYVSDKDTNLDIWDNLTNKSEEFNKMRAQNNRYSLPGNVTIKETDSELENILEILEDSGENEYKFISDEIEEDESNYSGSFRIMIY